MAEAGALDWRIARALALVFLAAKLALLVLARPFMDETYYWMWGQHLSLSYLDHPPLIGWTAALSSVLGWNISGLRVGVLLTLTGDLWLLRAFAKLGEGDWRPRFWLTALLLLSVPMLFGLSSVALPDHLLIVFSLLALYGFERFRLSWVEGAPRWRFLYLTGVAIGLATLSKYTGVILAAGLLVYVSAVPSMRGLLARVHFYAAGTLALAMQAPVLAWNIQHGFSSMQFLVGGRAGLDAGSSLSGVTGYLLGAMAVLSPFALWAMLRFATARPDGHGSARLIFWLSSLGFLLASAFTGILIHWNAIAYVAALPYLASWFRPRWLVWAQVVYGALAIAIAATNYLLLPVTAIAGPGDQTSAWSYGWDEVAAATAELRASEGAGFIAATDYALASPLAFALVDPSVTSLSAKREAYDDWFDAAAHSGETAILVADRWRPLSDAVRARFDEVIQLRRLPISRFGRTVDIYTLYAARSFKP